MQMQHARIMDEMEGVMEHMRRELRDMKRRVCGLEKEVAKLRKVRSEEEGAESQGLLSMLTPCR
jgi:predicted RNase H-like nuclease (RuvC/YqgF family)